MAAGQGFPGRDVILKWDGAIVPGVREKSAAVNKEPIDVTADDSAGWRELLAKAAQHQVDISISGATKSPVLRIAAFSTNENDSIKPVTIEYPDGGTITGDFYLASYNETGTHNDAVTFEASLQSTGPVTYTPGP